jgi:hypothetical protein
MRLLYKKCNMLHNYGQIVEASSFGSYLPLRG